MIWKLTDKLENIPFPFGRASFVLDEFGVEISARGIDDDDDTNFHLEMIHAGEVEISEGEDDDYSILLVAGTVAKTVIVDLGEDADIITDIFEE